MSKIKIDSDYLETFFEVSTYISRTVDVLGTMANVRMNSQGTGGLYELAEELTDKFQERHKNTEWDGEFFDTLELFFKEQELFYRNK